MNEKDFIIKKTFALASQNHRESQLRVAENLYKKILKINPNHFESIFYLGVLFIETNNLNKAKQLFQKIIQIKPDYVPAYNNLGIIFNSLKEKQKAIASYQKAIQIKPDYTPSYNNLGMVFIEMGEFEKAISHYEMAVKIKPNYLAAHHNLGIAFQKKREHYKAISCFQKAIQIKSDYADSYYNLGMVFIEMGEFEKAISHYEMAVKYQPENLIYLYYLSDLRKEILQSNLKNKIHKIIKKKNSSKKNIAYGNFLLAKYEEKNQHYKKEFDFLLKGHYYYFKSQSEKFKLQVKYWLKILPKEKKIFNSKKLDKNNNEIRPIFIVGLPRSGSTLIEKVIVSGSQYIPAGEETEILNFFVKQEILQKRNSKFNIEDFKQKIIDKYKEKGLIQKEKNYIFTDKSLDNFFYINLIKKIFPLAKVINCKRNTLSCIMSILKNNMTGLGWSHNLKHIFNYINFYYKIIKKIKKNYPNFIYEVEYEKFVMNPEQESKKILKFCNLSWHKKCLNFYQRKDLISQTASNIQIRKGIYKEALKKYLPYKRFLNKFGSKYNWFN